MEYHQKMTLLIVLSLIGLLGYIRFAPSDLARWHDTVILDVLCQGALPDVVIQQMGGAFVWLSPQKGAADILLQRLDAVAIATSRTTRLAGSVAQGKITWVTRSKIFGFPDYTTAKVQSGGPEGTAGLCVFGRLRFGQFDLGVNALRITGWIARL
jgi:hypothetical protein